MNQSEEFMSWFAVAYPKEYVHFVKQYLVFKKDIEGLINED